MCANAILPGATVVSTCIFSFGAVMLYTTGEDELELRCSELIKKDLEKTARRVRA